MKDNQALDSSGLTHEAALDWTEGVQDAFAANRSAVTTLYPHLNAAAETKLGTAIEAFSKCPTDETLDDQQQVLEEAADAARTALLTRWQQFKPSLDQLYPGNEAKQNVWGADDYLKARDSEGAFRGWAENWIACYTTYATDAGVSALPTLFQQSAIGGLYQDWKTKDHAHGVFVKNRPVLTQDRLLKKNAALEAARPFAEAGKGAFIADAARRALFYQPRQASEGSTASGTLRLQPLATLALGKLDLTDATSHLSVRLLTADGNPDVALEVTLWRADDAAAPAPAAARKISGSTRVVFPVADLGATGALVIVQNLTKQETVVRVSVVE